MVFENASMIRILYGEDIATSRLYYKKQQKNDPLVFDGEKVTHAQIEEALGSNGLFGNEKIICLENFFSKRKSSKEMDLIIASIEKNSSDTDIIFWESKQLSKKSLSVFPKAVTKSFPFPQSLFAFLDALQPNNTKKLLTLYHETLLHTESEMIFFMITRHIRLLLALSDTQNPDSIDEVKRLAPWQKSKLVSQSRQFPVKQLVSLHGRLADIDVKSKSGGLPMPLLETIDFLLLSI